MSSVSICVPPLPRSIYRPVWQLTPKDMDRYAPRLTRQECGTLFKKYSVFAIPRRQDNMYSWKHSVLATLGKSADLAAATKPAFRNSTRPDIVIVTQQHYQSPAIGWFTPEKEYASVRVQDEYCGLERGLYDASHLHPMSTLGNLAATVSRPPSLPGTPSGLSSPGSPATFEKRRSFFSPLPPVHELSVLTTPGPFSNPDFGFTFGSASPHSVRGQTDDPKRTKTAMRTDSARAFSSRESSSKCQRKSPSKNVTKLLPPISQYASAFTMPYSIQNALVRFAVAQHHESYLKQDISKLTSIAAQWVDQMSALPPPATLLNLVGAHSDADDCWKVLTPRNAVNNETSQRRNDVNVQGSPSKRRRVNLHTDSERLRDTLEPHNIFAKEMVAGWMKKRHVVVVGRVEWPEAFYFLAHRLGVLDSGYLYMCALDLYQRRTLEKLVLGFLQRILRNERFSEFIRTICNMDRSSRVSKDAVDATTGYIQSMSDSVMKRKRSQHSRATATMDNAPACIQQCIHSGVPMVNHIRMQLGAVVAAAAHESGMDWEVLAEPIINRVGQTDNKDRVPELKKWIEYAAKNPMDTRLCHTRRGPESFKSELTCPFKGGSGNDNVLACMNSRGVPLSPHLDLNSMTVSSLWTLKALKASHNT